MSPSSSQSSDEQVERVAIELWVQEGREVDAWNRWPERSTRLVAVEEDLPITGRHRDLSKRGYRERAKRLLGVAR